MSFKQKDVNNETREKRNVYTEGILRDILCFRVTMRCYNRSKKEELSWLNEGSPGASEARV